MGRERRKRERVQKRDKGCSDVPPQVESQNPKAPHEAAGVNAVVTRGGDHCPKRKSDPVSSTTGNLPGGLPSSAQPSGHGLGGFGPVSSRFRWIQPPTVCVWLAVPHYSFLFGRCA
ncbi:unnamed protein product [Bursaphelenchus okinawaensis]|uniref:Uncharacterized protein n=1 Tax=Bursaphelenchus okinawaensis TaxID=465554 RepID=A0A811JUS8_9BILA|nr:unnamed protein product [Bursaphelenchus okinawaensis]CAG9083409.1 unnamed protein product [Bursaphelenchus okinawaensis]